MPLGSKRSRSREQLALAFWERVAKGGEAECWPWLRGRAKKGYGVISHERKQVRASHLAWILSHEEIPDGMLVLHRCDNPPCCNPAHLFLGTIGDNMRDRNTKGRQAKGEATGAAKLTAEKVSVIRQRLAAGDSQSDLGRDFGVSTTAIRHIKNGKNWRHHP